MLYVEPVTSDRFKSTEPGVELVDATCNKTDHLAIPKLGGWGSHGYTRPLLTGVPSQLLHHGSRSCTIDSTFTPTFYQGLLWSVVAISLLQPIPATLPRSGVHPRCSPCEKETESPNTWMPANAQEFHADPCGDALNIPKHSYLADMELACVGLRLLWCLRCRTHHPCLDSHATPWKNVSSFNFAIWSVRSVLVHLSSKFILDIFQDSTSTSNQSG